MPKLNYFMICESASVDAATNRVSLFLIADHRWLVRTFPHFIAQLVLVADWAIFPEDRGRAFQVCFKVVLPNGQASELRSNYTPESEYVRCFGHFLALQIDRPGTLAFEVLLNGQSVAVKEISILPKD